MAVKTRSRRRAPQRSLPPIIADYLPGWLILAAVMSILFPNALPVMVNAAGQVISRVPEWVGSLFAGPSPIAPLFTDEIDHWARDIGRWAEEHELEPNLLATVMQIESCGHPTISSYAGAQGLFQVMPFHFTAGENQLDPDTNARRGAAYLKWCVDYSGGDVGLTLACYNGGPSVVKKPFAAWSSETQRYYRWGVGIYADALTNQSHSDTLDRWLAAGGGGLCRMAAGELGL
ncbi:MAG: hypothetical protein BroJett038_17220 [Chloroflexota bacterium]|jgi:soluble lytic murein transglycosylase-like protein|nr:MAG: hypothetical protein BroJett038_17220 [Chloroflexota bacterium]